MQGTIRTFREDVRLFVLGRFRELVQGVAAAYGCQAEIELKPVTPAVVNDPELTQRAARVAQTIFPEHKLIGNYQNMVSEDMALIMQDIPGCYFFIGSQNASLGLNESHHHPGFNFDEQALFHASAVMAGVAFEILKGQRTA